MTASRHALRCPWMGRVPIQEGRESRSWSEMPTGGEVVVLVGGGSRKTEEGNVREKRGGGKGEI